jgi:hypothetical protein
MSDEAQRLIFGLLAFLVAGGVIAGVLSPLVPVDKEAIANVILGNALSWPAIVLAFHYGSSSGSKAKTRMLDQGGENAPE